MSSNGGGYEKYMYAAVGSGLFLGGHDDAGSDAQAEGRAGNERVMRTGCDRHACLSEDVMAAMHVSTETVGVGRVGVPDEDLRRDPVVCSGAAAVVVGENDGNGAAAAEGVADEKPHPLDCILSPLGSPATYLCRTQLLVDHLKVFGGIEKLKAGASGADVVKSGLREVRFWGSIEPTVSWGARGRVPVFVAATRLEEDMTVVVGDVVVERTMVVLRMILRLDYARSSSQARVGLRSSLGDRDGG